MPTVEELKALAIEEIDKRKEEIIGHAKHILNNPEVGFTEFKTSTTHKVANGPLPQTRS